MVIFVLAGGAVFNVRVDGRLVLAISLLPTSTRSVRRWYN